MSQSIKTIAMVAGEASGDLLGSHLMEALKQDIPGIRFIGIGGPKMQAAGMEVLFPMEKLAVRGYVEVLRHYFEILGIRRKLRAQFISNPPDLFIGVDAPDFNLDLELALKQRGVPIVHYVSPSIWAWRGGRIHKIKRAVSHMLALFPFEAPLYEKAGVPVTYVGHPLAD
ncbi:MAG: lipid-A-disaccharide synthase, partial [Betaproteobacteria bacterium]|nr:lipid-A-disaccharide synthase [Betaproteobacteria bacterium]